MYLYFWRTRSRSLFGPSFIVCAPLMILAYICVSTARVTKALYSGLHISWYLEDSCGACGYVALRLAADPKLASAENFVQGITLYFYCRCIHDFCAFDDARIVSDGLVGMASALEVLHVRDFTSSCPKRCDAVTCIGRIFDKAESKDVDPEAHRNESRLLVWFWTKISVWCGVLCYVLSVSSVLMGAVLVLKATEDPLFYATLAAFTYSRR